jgi:hypothetical protein
MNVGDVDHRLLNIHMLSIGHIFSSNPGEITSAEIDFTTPLITST